MKAITYNNTAFDGVISALENIEFYNNTKKVSYLESAEDNLQKAIKEDPEYFDASYYLGIVFDLIGKAADAVPIFEKILENYDCDSKLKTEVLYNYGVANYHRYSHKYLESAEKSFLDVLNKDIDNTFKYLIYSNLAQTYAMWMRPNFDQLKLLSDSDKKKQILNHVNIYYKKFEETEKEVLNALKGRRIDDEQECIKIEAITNNARGMALMYYTDFVDEENNQKIKRLEESLENLLASEKKYPMDWANTCDIGSCYWRLAIWESYTQKKEEYYKKAIEFYEKVLNELRPNYGFALYELGNIYRTWGKFDIAIKYYEESMKVPDKFRDISIKSVKKGELRAEKEDSAFL